MSQTALFDVKTDDPRIDRLILFLKDRGWLTRTQIHDALGWDHRTIRAIVQASNGEILAGQQGYKITIQATHEEFQKSDGALGSQIQKNTQRRSQQSRVFHGGTKRPCLQPAPNPEPQFKGDLFAPQSAYGTGA